MPIIEIAVLIQVGGAIGLLSTLAIIIATAILGTFMLRQQGLATLTRAQSRLAAGEMPAQQVAEGVFLLIGGVLLLTPGFVTDAFGFLCLLPPTRRWMANRLGRRIAVGGFTTMSGNARGDGLGGMFGGGAGAPGSTAASGRRDGSRAQPRQQGTTLEGEYHKED